MALVRACQPSFSPLTCVVRGVVDSGDMTGPTSFVLMAADFDVRASTTPGSAGEDRSSFRPGALSRVPTDTVDDFPWFRYVHRGKESPGCEPERLTFTESPKSAAVSALRVNCSVCPATRTMEDAFGQRAANALGECLGSRPWLKSAEVPACESPLRTTLRGASNLYFGLCHTALSIPEWDDPVHLAIAHHEEQLGLVDTLEQLRMGIGGGFLPRLERFEPERVLDAIKRRREQEEKQPTPPRYQARGVRSAS